MIIYVFTPCVQKTSNALVLYHRLFFSFLFGNDAEKMQISKSIDSF